jgi:hypothetical protein
MPVETEECDILNLSRLSMHPAIAPLMNRRQGLQEKKAALLEAQQQCEAMLRDFERVNALELAEEQPEISRKRKDLKQQLTDSEDQITLVEAGLTELDQQIDDSMGVVREAIQAEIDALFAPEVEAMVEALQAILERNDRLHAIERCSARLLQTGRLELFNPGLVGWLFRLERKLTLVAPQ